MGIRGLWNLRVQGKWYLFCDPRAKVSPPEAPATLQRVKAINDHTVNLNAWDQVPFPSPFRSNFDYVYTIDQDAGTFKLSTRVENDGISTYVVLGADLASVCAMAEITTDQLLPWPPARCISSIPHDGGVEHHPPTLIPLKLDTEPPSPIMELQEKLFTDFVYIWRFWFDDPLTWCFGSSVVKSFCRAFLCLAAWDFEVSRDPDVHLPVNHTSVPSWPFPLDDVYWFHGFLIILCEDITSESLIREAISKARSFVVKSRRTYHKVRAIIISLVDVLFAEFSDNDPDGIVACSQPAPLLTNTAAMQSTPGFRLLAQIFISERWKQTWHHRERWLHAIPPEVISVILRSLEPRDTVALAQASYLCERWYYASIPQFQGMTLQRFAVSVPCCGQRHGLEEAGIRCCACRAWRHMQCLGLDALPLDKQWICPVCQKDPQRLKFEYGGVHRFSVRREGTACHVKIGDHRKILQIRLSKPAHLRPELRLMGNWRFPPGLIEFTVRFNGSFTGLAYGLDDETTR